jgi:endogenous inhibitor of DNA gyrase (YacG/DUF329 family)
MPDRDPEGGPDKAEPAPVTDQKVTPIRARRPCPECGRPSSREAYPFCSTRCKEIDLNRWFSGAYSIPVTEEEENGDTGDGGDR